jgi:ornithine carbamoyltransferase
MYHGIEYRGFKQARAEELAQHVGVPVWNGLTDEFHPTPALADILTMQEHSTNPLNRVVFAYMGDGRNNVANSLLVAAVKMGINCRVVTPKELHPSPGLVQTAIGIAKATGAKISITADVAQGVADCDFLYTDVWVSMGEPDAVWADRISLLQPYHVSRATMEQTRNPKVKFLHCLPVLSFTVYEEGKPLASCFTFPNHGKTQEIAGVYSDPGHRRRGLARRVVEKALHHLGHAGLLARYQVQEDNRAPILLAESIGLRWVVTYEHWRHDPAMKETV